MKEERKALENCAFKSRVILFGKIKLAESQFFIATMLFVGKCVYYQLEREAYPKKTRS